MTVIKPQNRIWSAFKNLLQRAGLDIFLYQPGYHYVPDYYGKAAAKGIDILANPEFKRLAEIPIHEGRTLLYYDRLYVIYQSLIQLNRLVDPEKDIDIAEIGTYQGGTTFFIASVHDAIGLNAKTIHCFDTFEGHSAQDIDGQSDYHRHTPNLFGDVDFIDVKEYLKKFNNVSVHKGRFQDSCHAIQDRQFGFVHLDVDLYEPTCFALDFFHTHLISGGVIVLDDYGTRSCPGVIKAVGEFIDTHQNYFLFHPFTEQCVLVKL